MRTSCRITALLLVPVTLILMSASALAADPGLPFDDAAPVNDQRAGSVLFYNIYTSSATAPATENTRISITNTSSSKAVSVHLFFVEGSSCSSADNMLCLTANQTASFGVSDLDPGTTGYIIAIAADDQGRPVKHNFLIGDLYVKFASGHQANLGAEAVGAIEPPDFDDTTVFLTLNFNGVEYGRLPAVVAVSNLQSRADGNDTTVIINRPSGNLAIGADSIGALVGILFNDAENAFSFSFFTNQCQFKFSFTNTTPRTVPRFNNIVPVGRTGWVKLFTLTGAPLLGAVINLNQGASPRAFNHGHNLHKLTLTTSSVTIPVFAPNC